MSSIVPSPPVAPDADATTRGVVNPTAADQTLGVGTAIHRFANLVTSALATLQSVLTNLVYATGATLVLRSSLGAGSSDIAVKVGTSETDGTVNTSARLFSACTGIGGTEVERAYVNKTSFNLVGHLSSSRFGLEERTGGASSQMAFRVAAITPMAFDISSGAVWVHYALRFFNAAGTVEVAQIDTNGELRQSGTDSSGSPGAATINKPTGKSAIASGATSVVITNSLVAAGDQVFITWHGDLGTQSKIPWVTTAAGSFTVNVGTAPGSAVAFCWSVSKRI